MRAHILKVFGGLAVVGVLLVGGVTTPALAETYPSWNDVLNARKSTAAKAAEVTRIQKLIAALEADLAEANRVAEIAGTAYQKAQEQFADADQRSQELQAQAEASQKKADDAKALAGRLGAELYRSGGSDMALNMMLQGGDTQADQMLSRLGSMSKLVERSSQIYSEAISAQNEAKALQDQAKIALAERERLQEIAQKALEAAQAAQQQVQAKLEANEAHNAELRGQLAALQAASDATASQYQVGVEVARQAALAKAREEAAARGIGISDAGWTTPVNGSVSDGYGPRTSVWTGSGWSSSFHRGLDFSSGCNAPLYAASGGTVIYAGWNGGFGYHVQVNHGGGIVSTYSHIRSGGILVHYGEQVGPGARIAYSGTTGTSTGCHLHFEVRVNGSAIDPRAFLRARGVSV